MIVVDSSVWIGHLRNQTSSQVTALRSVLDPDEIIVGDLVLLEVLRGARDERHAEAIGLELGRFLIEQMLDETIAVVAARRYRQLRRAGRTIKATDLIIATFCMENGHALLHQDRDFEPLHALGLTYAPIE